jgi:hypothetical protein
MREEESRKGKMTVAEAGRKGGESRGKRRE